MEQAYNFIASLPLIPLVFGAVFVFYWIYTLIIMYHLMRFGVGPQPKIIAIVFFAGSLILFANMILAYSRISFSVGGIQSGIESLFNYRLY